MTIKTKFIFFISVALFLATPLLLVQKANALMMDGIQPARGPRGTAVTIIGTGWSPTPGENRIMMSEYYNYKMRGVLVATAPASGNILVFTIPNDLRGDKTIESKWDIWVENPYGGSTETRWFTVTPSAPSCTPATGPWSACSVSCGGGTQTRTITNANCSTRVESQSCNTQACPPPPPPLPPTPPSTPTPTAILKTLSISPQTYSPGDTVNGSATLEVASPVTASFRIELYKDGQLVWSRDIDGIYLAAQSYTVPLETVLGFKPTLPDNPSLYGSWEIRIIRKDISESLSQTFSIAAAQKDLNTTNVSFQPVTVSLVISPQNYRLEQTLNGSATVINSNETAVVTAEFDIQLVKIEKWSNVTVWRRTIPSVRIEPGTFTVSLDDVFGFKPTIPASDYFWGIWYLGVKTYSSYSGSVVPTTIWQEFKIQ